jgi:hypothetical protein
MKPEAQDVALAILARVDERAGFVNKTKLLKLLYLADIEHYRRFGDTLTGFDWTFHIFGPWAAEYDILLAELERKDAIALEAWTGADREGARISLRDPRELDKVIRNADEFYRIRHQVDTWNDRSLSDLLDYVYFETEPMSEAVSGERLRFEKVNRDAPKLYRRTSSKTHPESLKRLKEKFQALRAASEERRQKTLREFRRPAYDEVYESALQELDERENGRA